ncbi:MAG: glutamyl-tRNA reductase, partial [Anaerolineales bacterium]|nr:glutamyl-tRNA reductase [Anaerolineales bacterium]
MADQSIHIQCLGLNHNSASVALRELLAFTPHRLDAALARIGCGNDPAWCNLRELVILSTCNRVELYTVTVGLSFDQLEAFLADVQDIHLSELSTALYHLMDEEAVSHLLNVAAGLDSVVLGEPQILGQVTDAYTAARRNNSAGKILSRLFQTAIQAGKRARTETAIGHNPASIASIAIKLISEVVPDISSSRIMVLGAGEMAELAVEALRKRGANQIVVVNRTIQRAQELAHRWNGQAAALEMLLELLPETDIVITSTGAPHTIIHKSMVENSMYQRANQPIVFMDIAVPRDVDPDVKEVAGVRLFDMDTLSEQLETSLAQRKAEVPHVSAILAEERAYFVDYLATLDLLPLIIELRTQVNAIRQAEVDKAMRRIPDLSPEAEQRIDALTKSIVQKILHN